MSETIQNFDQLFDENERREIEAQSVMRTVHSRHLDAAEIMTDENALKIMDNPEHLQRIIDAGINPAEEIYQVCKEITDPINTVFGEDGVHRGDEWGHGKNTELDDFLES